MNIQILNEINKQFKKRHYFCLCNIKREALCYLNFIHNIEMHKYELVYRYEIPISQTAMNIFPST
jgi:hypothetical protein